MKKVFTGAMLFIVAVLIADRLLFFAIDILYKRTYIGQEGGDINKYLKDPITPELVIMGSSTAKFQVNPDSFPVKAANLAHSMTTDCYQAGLLSLMVKHKKAPRNILLSVWPRNYQLTGIDRQSEDILFLKYYYDQSDFIRTQINNISRFERCKYVFASYKFNGMLTNVLKYYYRGRKINTDKYFFQYQESSVNDSLNTIAAVAARNKVRAKNPAPLSRLQMGYLVGFIDSCKKNNINLMCYYMPQLQEDTILVKNASIFLDSIFAVKQIPYLKFNEVNLSQVFNNPAFWSDGEHVNYKGGSIQSKMLSNFVTPLLRR
ncbi:hypothetical protein BH09BAC2_BH09BAC2_03240 [soil metagenome]